MTPDYIFNVFNNLLHDKVSFIYQGTFSHPITPETVKLVESNISEQDSYKKIKNKISYLIIESFQNVVRHGDCEPAKDILNHSGLFIARNYKNIFFITSANPIENKHIEGLRKRLEKINTLDKKSLSKLYMEVLSNRELSEKGGAGLGLLQMARKTGQKLDFEFLKLTDDVSMFFLQLKMKNKKNPDIQDVTLPLSSAVEIYKEIHETDIFVIHKGIFSQESMRPVLNMAENNFNSALPHRKKVVFHLLVEVLQNISKHAFAKDSQREGVFMLGSNQDNYFIGTGNYVSKEVSAELSKMLDLYSSMNPAELKKLYGEKLRTKTKVSQNGAGLGLIDVVREASQPIDYKVFPSENSDFFAMKIVV